MLQPMPLALAAAQMISKEADPQVCSVIVLHPGTQRCGFVSAALALPSYGSTLL